MKYLYAFDATLFVHETKIIGGHPFETQTKLGEAIPVSVIADSPENAERQALQALTTPAPKQFWLLMLTSIGPVPYGF